MAYTKTTQTIGRYANILLDYWFKRTFGEEREKLMRLFLQELIPERKIVKLTYAPQEHVNPWPGQKDIRVDVECTDADGTRFVVEMQLAEQEFFYERAVFNSSFAIQEQMRKGADEYDFPTVYFIGITDFSIHKESSQVMYRYSIREDSTGEQMTKWAQRRWSPVQVSWTSYAMPYIICSLLKKYPRNLRVKSLIYCLIRRKSLILRRQRKTSTKTT